MLDIIWKEQTESNACITYNMMYKIIQNTEPQWEQGNQILFFYNTSSTSEINIFMPNNWEFYFGIKTVIILFWFQQKIHGIKKYFRKDS